MLLFFEHCLTSHKITFTKGRFSGSVWHVLVPFPHPPSLVHTNTFSAPVGLNNRPHQGLRDTQQDEGDGGETMRKIMAKGNWEAHRISAWTDLTQTQRRLREASLDRFRRQRSQGGRGNFWPLTDSGVTNQARKRGINKSFQISRKL